MSETLQLTGSWSLRKLVTAGRPQWALQYKGMDWAKISEFLEAGNPTLDQELRNFAADITREIRECDRDCERYDEF